MMHYEFEHLDTDQSRRFIQYFTAAIRDPVSGMIPGSGSAGWSGDEYVVQTGGNFQFEGSKLYAAWQLNFDTDRTLKSITSTTSVATPTYESTLQRFVSKILERSLGDVTRKVFQRDYLTSVGWRMEGEYWIDGFRFAPLFPDDDCTLGNAEFLYVIDQEVDAIDKAHGWEIARTNSDRISSILSTILDLRFERPLYEHRHFLFRGPHREEGGWAYEMKRESTQLIDMTLPKEMPKKGELATPLGFEKSIANTHERYAGDTIVLPEETRKIFRNSRLVDSKTQSAFEAACIMYQLALTVGFGKPTVKSAYQYGAIDSIVQSDKKRYGSFSSFMQHYSSVDKELSNLIHGKIRSAHWHAGKLPLGELSHVYDMLFDPGKLPLFAIQRQVESVLREALVNWILENIVNVEFD